MRRRDAWGIVFMVMGAKGQILSALDSWYGSAGIFIGWGVFWLGAFMIVGGRDA